jgi:glycosyltransferase involved in cell wall biosynthesis
LPDLPQDRPVVVYSGGLLPVKGLEQLHATIAAAAERDLAVHFLLIGYPTEATERFVAEHGLQSRCTLTGRVNFGALPALLAAADIAIEPKLANAGEASGKLLNYMAAGLPVVAFDTANNREMLAEAGCYACADRPGQMVDCIAELAADAGRRARLGEAALARVSASYSWDASAALLDQLYRRCAGRAS